MLAGGRVFPDIVKFDLQFTFIFFVKFFKDGLHHFAGDTFIGTKVN